MDRNRVLFEVGGSVWRISDFCWACGGGLVLGFLLGFVVLRRYGKSRRLSREEAASVAMHAGEVSEVDRAVTYTGPAAGKEWEVSMSIGDMRKAYRDQDWFRFLGLGSVILITHVSAGMLIWCLGELTGSKLIAGMGVGWALMFLGVCSFMWWAAIYTDLK